MGTEASELQKGYKGFLKLNFVWQTDWNQRQN